MFLFSLANEIWAMYRRQLIILGIFLLVLKFIPTGFLELALEWNKCTLLDCGTFWQRLVDMFGGVIPI